VDAILQLAGQISVSFEFCQMFSVFFPNFRGGGNGWLCGPIKRAPCTGRAAANGPHLVAINSLDSVQRFHNKASLYKDNTSMPHL
jgi:hypothetical protein